MVQSAVRNPEQRVTARVILNRKSSKRAPDLSPLLIR